MASGYVSPFQAHTTSYIRACRFYIITPRPGNPSNNANNHQLESHHRPDHSRRRLRSSMVPQPERREPNVSDSNPSAPGTLRCHQKLTPGKQCLAQHTDSLVHFVLFDVGYVSFLDTGSAFTQQMCCVLFFASLMHVQLSSSWPSGTRSSHRRELISDLTGYPSEFGSYAFSHSVVVEDSGGSPWYIFNCVGIASPREPEISCRLCIGTWELHVLELRVSV